MRKTYQLILISGILLGLVMPGPQVAKGQTKRYKFGNTVYTLKASRPRASHLSDYQIRLNLRELRHQTLHDIRLERTEHVSTSIKANPKLNRLANLRAQQVAKHFSHYGHNHRPMTTVDAKKVGLPRSFQGSENIASCDLGNCTIVADPKIYHNRNGRDMANMSNDGMMNYDQFEQNGHRKNILSNGNTLVGVGAAYSRRKHTFYLAEDFGNRNPQSSEDVDKPNLRIHLKHAQSIGQIIKRDYYQVVRYVQSLF